MIQYRKPVRINVPEVLRYTFKDQDNNIIDLTNYATVWLESKLQGQVYSTTASTFINPQTSGQVQLLGFVFPTVGTWNIQFYCVDSMGNKLFGEPLQVMVVPNVENLSLDQLAVY